MSVPGDSEVPPLDVAFGGLIGLHVQLLPVDFADRAAIYRLLRQDLHPHVYRGIHLGTATNTIDTLLGDGVLSQFVISGLDSELIGLVQCLTPNWYHGTAQLAVAIRHEFWSKGWPLEGARRVQGVTAAVAG